jgi:hypothetical protein
MARTQVYSNKQMIDALNKFKGAVYLAAESIGCNPDTIYDRANKSPEVKRAITRHRGKMLDTAEMALYNAVLKGESWAIAFALKSVGRKRGYGDKIELDIGVAPKLLKELKQRADSAGVDLASVFESMIAEFANVNAAANREE